MYIIGYMYILVQCLILVWWMDRTDDQLLRIDEVEYRIDRQEREEKEET